MDEQEYKLALDEQVVKYLEIRHKHTYFIITAAIVVLAFVINFASANNLLSSLDVIPLLFILIGALASLSVAGIALWSLSYDNYSYQIHLRYLHQSKGWEDLKGKQKIYWKKVNKRASKLRNSAFTLLIIGVFSNTLFLTYQLYSQGANKMHHYGEDSTEIISHQDYFEILFTNKVTEQKIRMTIPRVGSRENASGGLTIEDIRTISGQINDVLRSNLGEN